MIALLATASLGAIWASCTPEFGPRGVIDPFAQLRPSVLLTRSGAQPPTERVVARSITCQPGGSSGVGVANLYPLSLALTLAAAPRNGDRAQAATQLLGGGLVIAAPYLLGSLADHLGLHAAFAIDLVLIGACAALLLAGLRSGDVEQRGERPQHV